MKRYLNLLLSFFKYSIKTDLEYRFSAIGNFIFMLISMVLNIFLVGVFFSFSKHLNGWDENQAFLLVGVFRVIMSIFGALFRSVNVIAPHVQRGDLDIFLTKPINSQFYLSLRFPRVFGFLEALPGFILIFYSLTKLGNDISYFNALGLIVSLTLGIIIFYSIYFSLATLVLWLKNFYSFVDLYYIIREPLTIPIDILGKATAFVLTFIIPLGFIITIPVKIFLGKESAIYFFISAAIAILLFSFSVWFWNFSLKRYTSASS